MRHSRSAVQVDSGENPEPTVTVRMGEGLHADSFRIGCVWFDMQLRILPATSIRVVMAGLYVTFAPRWLCHEGLICR